MKSGTESKRPLALVTGASSGIGYELAKQFALHGYDLIIVAENAAIVEAAQTCRNIGANVDSYQIDLAKQNGADELIEKITAQKLFIDAIAINPGAGFAENSSKKLTLEDELRLINLNVVSSVHLTKHVLKDMMEKRKGRILITSFLTGDIPSSMHASYNASRAFIQFFCETLRDDLKNTGVTVTSYMLTKFYEKKDNFELLAEQGFEAVMTGLK